MIWMLRRHRALAASGDRTVARWCSWWQSPLDLWFESTVSNPVDYDECLRTLSSAGRTTTRTAPPRPAQQGTRDRRRARAPRSSGATPPPRSPRSQSAAGVSVDTVYKAFGTKAVLTKHVYDVALAGDDEPIPLRERPEFRAIVAEPDPRQKVAIYAALARQIAGRLGPLLNDLLSSRGVDPDLDAFVHTIDNERLIGSASFVRHLADTGQPPFRPRHSTEPATSCGRSTHPRCTCCS